MKNLDNFLEPINLQLENCFYSDDDFQITAAFSRDKHDGSSFMLFDLDGNIMGFTK